MSHVYHNATKKCEALYDKGTFAQHISKFNPYKSGKPQTQKSSMSSRNLDQRNNKETLQVSKQFQRCSIGSDQQSSPKLEVYKFNSIDYSKKLQIQQHGLPNLGNTCFLNSIIQSLFALTQFRKRIINQISKKASPFVVKLGKVFYSMQNLDSSIQDKRRLMTFFISQLKNRHMNYQGSSQEDFLDFLMLILNNLQQQSKNLTELFNITLTEQCQNSSCQKYKKRQKFKSVYIKHTDEKCSKCFKILKKRILSHPKYLIVLGGDKGHQVKLLNYQQEDLNYKLSAKILYSGSGRCGHYVSERKILSKTTGSLSSESNIQSLDWRIFNDNSIQTSRGNYFDTKCSFYQFVQKPLKNEIKNTVQTKMEIQKSLQETDDDIEKQNKKNSSILEKHFTQQTNWKKVELSYKQKPNLVLHKQYRLSEITNDGRFIIFQIGRNKQFWSYTSKKRKEQEFPEFSFCDLQKKIQNKIIERYSTFNSLNSSSKQNQNNQRPIRIQHDKNYKITDRNINGSPICFRKQNVHQNVKIFLHRSVRDFFVNYIDVMFDQLPFNLRQAIEQKYDFQSVKSQYKK